MMEAQAKSKIDDVTSSPQQRLHVVVVVLGDLGRSPRMQYHALSLLQEGYVVSLVGYTGEDLIPPLQGWTLPTLTVIRMSPSGPTFLRKFFRPFYYLWRLVSLIVNLVYALLVSVPSKPPVDCILVQNPPAVPLLIVSRICCWILGYFSNRSRRQPPGLVFDWHNLGYTMFDSGSTVQKWTKKYEQWIGPKADGHLTVTSAMRAYLQDDFLQLQPNDNIRVLYDCPPTMFRPLSIEEQHEILTKLQTTLCSACPRSWYENLTENQTLFTERHTDNGTVQPRRGRPALITSSTSWTPDEDFGILLDALIQLENTIKEEKSHDMKEKSLPPLQILVAVTGKGPLKEYYEEKISKMKLENVAVQTLWLEPGDYPKILACADVGISLHTSTSGLDLPMKVLDLFGCATPVCALNFNCLSELVKDGTNGRVFDTSQELADQLWTLLKPLTAGDGSGEHYAPHAFGILAEYSNNLMKCKRWSENWKVNALPVLKRAAGIDSDES